MTFRVLLNKRVIGTLERYEIRFKSGYVILATDIFCFRAIYTLFSTLQLCTTNHNAAKSDVIADACNI